MEHIIWLLEFICVTFNAEDYLEAIAVLPAITFIIIGVIVLILMGCHWFANVLLQIRLVRRFENLAEKKGLIWCETVLDFFSWLLEGLYVELSWQIKNSRNNLVRKQQLLSMRLSLLDKQKSRMGQH